MQGANNMFLKYVSSVKSMIGCCCCWLVLDQVVLWHWTCEKPLHVIHLLIFFRITSLALGQSYDCPSASEVILNNMGKTNSYQTTTKHNKAWTVYIILGMYYIIMAIESDDICIIFHRPLGCLFKSLFMLMKDDPSKLCIACHLCWKSTGNEWIPCTKGQ